MRRVVIHKKQRGRQQTRYQLINWAFRMIPQLKKSNRVERHKIIDKHLGDLLDNYSAMRVSEVMRIWCRFSRLDCPISLVNFERFHSRCHHIFVRGESPENESEKTPFFLYAKSRVEFLTRVKVVRPDMPELIQEFLKNQTGYSPMSEAEYTELKQAIKDHLEKVKYDPSLETFDVQEWRLTRADRILNRLYCLDSPE